MFFCFCANGQTVDTILLNYKGTISSTGDCVGTDGVNNVYFLSKSNFLVKYDENGKELFNYNSLFLNSSTIISCENPFKTILYYPDQGKIAVLDRRLSLNAEIDLNKTDYLNISAVCASQDNQNLWIFDDGSKFLYKIDQSGKAIISIDIRSIRAGLKANLSAFTKLIESNDYLFCIKANGEVVVLDNFGNYNTDLILPCLPNEIEAFDGKIIYKKNNLIEAIDIKTKQKFAIPIDVNLNQIILGKGIIIGKSIEEWKIFKF
jgi:hypothetical protein